MATNPMQRKARNSFLLGMLVMLLILGIVIALLFMQLMNKVKKEKEDSLQAASLTFWSPPLLYLASLLVTNT